jgi:hypothetical protein
VGRRGLLRRRLIVYHKGFIVVIFGVLHSVEAESDPIPVGNSHMRNSEKDVISHGPINYRYLLVYVYMFTASLWE